MEYNHELHRLDGAILPHTLVPVWLAMRVIGEVVWLSCWLVRVLLNVNSQRMLVKLALLQALTGSTTKNLYLFSNTCRKPRKKNKE